MENKDILGFAIDRASVVNTYWNIFLSVATAILGVVATMSDSFQNILVQILLSAVFIVFAYSNYQAIKRLGKLRETLLAMLPKEEQPYAELVENLRPASSEQYKHFHLCLDGFVLAVIWLVPYLQ